MPLALVVTKLLTIVANVSLMLEMWMVFRHQISFLMLRDVEGGCKRTSQNYVWKGVELLQLQPADSAQTWKLNRDDTDNDNESQRHFLLPAHLNHVKCAELPGSTLSMAAMQAAKLQTIYMKAPLSDPWKMKVASRTVKYACWYGVCCRRPPCSHSVLLFFYYSYTLSTQMLQIELIWLMRCHCWLLVRYNSSSILSVAWGADLTHITPRGINLINGWMDGWMAATVAGAAVARLRNLVLAR